MHAKRVLLAHRDSNVQDLASRALARIGVSLDVAADAAEAVLHIAREPYTVIAAEADDAVLAAIAQTYVDRRPVVIVTSPETPTPALDADIVSMVVPEPIDPKTLVGVILACVTPIPPADFNLAAESLKDLK
jgi:hypothetical protein